MTRAIELIGQLFAGLVGAVVGAVVFVLAAATVICSSIVILAVLMWAFRTVFG